MVAGAAVSWSGNTSDIPIHIVREFAAKETLMKVLMTAVAMIALLGFVGFTQAAKEAKPKTTKGHFVKVDGQVLTYKGGAKGTGKEHTVKIDDKTKVTIDGKDAKVADLKADAVIDVTEVEGTATAIAANTAPVVGKK
jgi:hypothetical protein